MVNAAVGIAVGVLLPRRFDLCRQKEEIASWEVFTFRFCRSASPRCPVSSSASCHSTLLRSSFVSCPRCTAVKWSGVTKGSGNACPERLRDLPSRGRAGTRAGSRRLLRRMAGLRPPKSRRSVRGCIHAALRLPTARLKALVAIYQHIDYSANLRTQKT